jgi:putative acetyltransferase
MSLDIAIRIENNSRWFGRSTVNELAFSRPREEDLVDGQRAGCPRLVSLVAVAVGKLVGHILFSPAAIARSHGSLAGMGLAPIAVLPEFQRRGSGKALIEAGIETIRAFGEPFVIVLGHPKYYPTFGFVPALRFGIRCEYGG